jgi:hypothetical protein
MGGIFSYSDIWYDSVDKELAHHKASTYTGQHNTENLKKSHLENRGIDQRILN